MTQQSPDPAGTEDPRYRRGLVHLQSGAWQEAIDCFSEVARDYPDSPSVQRALDDARLKAKLDQETRVRAKRWVFPWRALLVRGLILLLMAFVAVQAVRLIQRQVAPALAMVRERQEIAQVERDCNDFYEGSDLENAEACYMDLLVLVPGHELAEERLQEIALEREIFDLYQQAVSLQETGNVEGAMALFSDILIRRPRYRDVTQRIQAINQQKTLDALFQEAEADYQAGRFAEAVSKYEQLRELDVGYRRDLVVQRLYELYMRLGRGLLEADPPASEGISQALGYFVAALELDPRSTEAALEKQLASLYLEGVSYYQAGNWEQAITRLRVIYDQRPGYLRGTVASMLYEAYVRSGDQYRDAEDCGLAYQRYGEAAALPVGDTALALARQSVVHWCLTPTPTPSNTPTPSPTPTRTPTPTPTPILPTPRPSPTPTPVPLRNYRGKIVFWSGDIEKPGIWLMDPDGENRQYLGESRFYKREFEDLRKQEAYSPDGRYRAFVTDAVPRPQVWIAQPPHPQFGSLAPIQLTHNTGLSYDPVWSPDGGRIAYVSTDNGSDDIWVIYTDGTGNRWLVNNDWEWDKHPSWSPDSRRIAFWSNRNGLKQIYLVDANGGRAENISNTDWDEYDPIWIK